MPRFYRGGGNSPVRRPKERRTNFLHSEFVFVVIGFGSGRSVRIVIVRSVVRAKRPSAGKTAVAVKAVAF